jgi:glutaredoxin
MWLLDWARNDHEPSVMNKTNEINALILVSSHCSHCHALETLLLERMASGKLHGLDVINIEQNPEVAQKYGVRSVPWLRLGDFVFDEALTPADLDSWIERATDGSGQSQYIERLLERGKLVKAIEWLEQGYASLKHVISVFADPDAKINVRVGIGAILEHFEDTPAIRDIIPDLVALLSDSHPAIRTDVCHYLSLTHSSDVIEPLKKMLDDEDEQVQQVAGESIEAIEESAEAD